MLKADKKLQITAEMELWIASEIYNEPLSGRALYKVKNPQTGIFYALKLYNLAQNDAASIAKEIEATNRARLEHSPKIHLFFERKNQAFVLMDWLDGVNLSQLFKKQPGNLAELKIRLNICEKLTLALLQLHKNGVIHRDLKPQNIMLLCQPRLKPSEILRLAGDMKAKIALIDFGQRCCKFRDFIH